jgi:hypothetical protein
MKQKFTAEQAEYISKNRKRFFYIYQPSTNEIFEIDNNVDSQEARRSYLVFIAQNPYNHYQLWGVSNTLSLPQKLYWIFDGNIKQEFNKAIVDTSLDLTKLLTEFGYNFDSPVVKLEKPHCNIFKIEGKKKTLVENKSKNVDMFEEALACSNVMPIFNGDMEQFKEQVYKHRMFLLIEQVNRKNPDFKFQLNPFRLEQIQDRIFPLTEKIMTDTATAVDIEEYSKLVNWLHSDLITPIP